MNSQSRKPTTQPYLRDLYDVVLTADGFRVPVILLRPRGPPKTGRRG